MTTSKKVFRNIIQLRRRRRTGGWSHAHSHAHFHSHRPVSYKHWCTHTNTRSSRTTSFRTAQSDTDQNIGLPYFLSQSSLLLWNRTTTSRSTSTATMAAAAAVFVNGLLLTTVLGDMDEESNNNSRTRSGNNRSIVVSNSIRSTMVVQCHDGGGNCSNNHKKADDPLDAFLNQQERFSKKFVTASDLDQEQDDDGGGGGNDEFSLPVYTLEDVAIRNGQNTSTGDGDGDDTNTEFSNDIWISYGGLVYDITDFVQSKAHPGGSERLLRAAGKPLEPYWTWHGQHFETEIPLKILQSYCPIVGRLTDNDQDKVDEEVEQLQTDLLPQIIQIEWRNRDKILQDPHAVQEVTLVQLQEEYPQTDQVSQVGCPNKKSKRRPVSTSVATGVTIQDLVVKSDIYKTTSVNDDNSSTMKIVDVTFHARDGEKVSVSGTAAEPTTTTTAATTAAKTTAATTTTTPECEKCQHKQPIHDVLLCYEMDGKPISRQRGFPIRAIIPGKRVVKWVERIVISYEVS